MEQSIVINMVCAYILSYKVAILSKDKDQNSRLTKHKTFLSKRELQTITFYHMAHKKKRVLTTVMRNAWIPQPCPGKGVPLLLIPEYSGINKGQRVNDRSKIAHRKPPVKCFLTQTSQYHSNLSLCPNP